MNKVILMGRLTRDVELKRTSSDTPYANFAIAIDRDYKPKDGERETDFINCVAWRQTAEFIAKWFGKGRMIAIDGSIQTRKYADKDGNNRTVTEVLVDKAYFCGDKSSGTAAPTAEFTDIDMDEELPF